MGGSRSGTPAPSRSNPHARVRSAHRLGFGRRGVLGFVRRRVSGSFGARPRVRSAPRRRVRSARGLGFVRRGAPPGGRGEVFVARARQPRPIPPGHAGFAPATRTGPHGSERKWAPGSLGAGSRVRSAPGLGFVRRGSVGFPGGHWRLVRQCGSAPDTGGKPPAAPGAERIQARRDDSSPPGPTGSLGLSRIGGAGAVRDAKQSSREPHSGKDDRAGDGHDQQGARPRDVDFRRL
jgi:hypothetical protein